MSVAVTHSSPNNKKKDPVHVLTTDRTVPVCQCVFKKLDAFPSIFQIQTIHTYIFRLFSGPRKPLLSLSFKTYHSLLKTFQNGKLKIILFPEEEKNENPMKHLRFRSSRL
jgi:hypothetical protein